MNKDKMLERCLIVLTFISLVISSLINTNAIYSMSSGFNSENLNNILISTPYNILLWVNNILIYILSIIYIVKAIKSKNNRVIKISFALLAILTTIIVQTLIFNFIGDIFKIF